jgi:OmpA-OmpF porin, OOP family
VNYLLTKWELPVNNMKKLALAVALVCSAGTALAQEINPSWYVQGAAAWMDTDKSFGVHKNGWGGALRFGKPINQWLDVQLGASHARASTDNSGDMWQTLYGVDAVLYASRQQLRPYVLLGLGGEHDHVSRPLIGLRKDTSWYYQGGVGVQYAINDRWAVQADARWVRGNPDDSKFGFDKSLTKYVTVGFTYALNPPPAPPAPPPAVEQPAPTPAPTEAPPPPPPPPARFEKVTMSAESLFAFDSAKLSMPQPKLDDIASTLQQNPTINDITITGYTDRLGSTKYNQKLSERRANAVREYLVSKGVEGSRLKAVGRGEQNPVATECHQKKRKELIECLAPNRRVEIEQITIERRVQ